MSGVASYIVLLFLWKSSGALLFSVNYIGNWNNILNMGYEDISSMIKTSKKVVGRKQKTIRISYIRQKWFL